MMADGVDSYDRIAHLYDVDMARSMPFDDVAFYLDCCRRFAACNGRTGRVLEIGCGNGRILLPLLAAGIDAFGIDRSAGMLAQLARKAGLTGRIQALHIARVDARALAFASAFDLVLCPYSVITYATADMDPRRMMDGIRMALRPGGFLVVDAFVPRETLRDGVFRLDYRRAFGEHTVERSKRITGAPGLDDRLNRIERRYRIIAADGGVIEQISTIEDIRPFTPRELEALVSSAGFTLVERWWDYGQRGSATDAQFCTIVAQSGK